jgi:uncharacterized membrane protein YdjX (TVP38/TMEM64 family)
MGMNLQKAWPRLGPVRWLLLAWAVMPPLATIVLVIYLKDLGPWLREHPQGVWIFAAGFAVLAGVALLPTYAQCFLGGYAFGFAVGFPAVVAGFAGGAIIGYEIARLVNGGRVMEVINEDAQWRAVRDALVGEGGSRPSFLKQLGMVILLRVPPNSPFALTNLAMAGMGVGRPAFLLGTAIGMAPRSAIFVMLGAGIKGVLDKQAMKEAYSWTWWIVGAAMTVVVALIIIAIARHALHRVVGSNIRVDA